MPTGAARPTRTSAGDLIVAGGSRLQRPARLVPLAHDLAGFVLGTIRQPGSPAGTMASLTDDLAPVTGGLAALESIAGPTTPALQLTIPSFWTVGQFCLHAGISTMSKLALEMVAGHLGKLRAARLEMSARVFTLAAQLAVAPFWTAPLRQPRVRTCTAASTCDPAKVPGGASLLSKIVESVACLGALTEQVTDLSLGTIRQLRLLAGTDYVSAKRDAFGLGVVPGAAFEVCARMPALADQLGVLSCWQLGAGAGSAPFACDLRPLAGAALET